jgi:putative membrane protein
MGRKIIFMVPPPRANAALDAQAKTASAMGVPVAGHVRCNTADSMTIAQSKSELKSMQSSTRSFRSIVGVRSRVVKMFGASSYACVACAVFPLVAGCDSSEQKPKVERHALAFVGNAAAQQADRVVPPTALSGAMQPVDRAFALFAASSGLAEIESARLTLRSSRNADVRDYALKLMREHARSGDELRRIVAPYGLSLPAAPTGRHADLVTKLSGVSVQDLDEAFLLRFGVDAHKETIALFERHIVEAKDPQLRRYAEQTLPMLREHMSAAHKLLYASAVTR